jgi:ATP-dependent DNA helicase RecQ
MGQIYGIGQAKLESYGKQVLGVIVNYCEANGVAMDVALRTPKLEKIVPKAPTSGVRSVAFELFRQGLVPEDVAHQTGRSVRAVMSDLADFIRLESSADVFNWMDAETYQRVAEVAKKVGTARLKPIFEELQGSVPYEEIRLVVAHLERGVE